MEDQGSTAGALAPETVTVSWQTAFWALVPLAMSVLVQPAGKFFGLEPRLSFFLRISPIICAGDLVAFGIRLGAMAVVEDSLGAAMSRALEYRDLIARPRPEREPQDYTWVRVVWFFFILLQAIKLFGLRGVPWLQTWGYFYFFSYCWYEIIAVISPRVSFRLRNTRVTQHWLFGSLAKLEPAFFVVTVFGQIVLLVKLLKSVVFNLSSSFPRRDLAAVDFPVLMAAAFLTVASVIYHDFPTDSDGTYWYIGILWFMIICILFFVQMFGFDTFNNIFEGVPIMYFFLFICSSVMFFAARRYPLARKLLLLKSDVDLSTRQLSLAVVSFTHLLAFFVLSLLWFRYSYDSTGTAKPDWINVFG